MFIDDNNLSEPAERINRNSGDVDYHKDSEFYFDSFRYRIHKILDNNFHVYIHLMSSTGVIREVKGQGK